MPIPPKKLREIRNDTTIERPARHISMVSEEAEAPAPAADNAAENTAGDNTPAPDAQSGDGTASAPQPGDEQKKD